MFFSPVLSTYAHTTVLFPDNLEGDKGIMIVHFHPYEGNGLMGIKLHVSDADELKGIESIYSIHEGKQIDCSAHALPVFFKVRNKIRQGYFVPIRVLGGQSGDHVLVVRHLPHWKKNLGIYIQKVSKYYLNNGGRLTDWPHRLLTGAPELIPLVPPYAVYTHTIFRAETMDDQGKYIPHAKIHVEFLNYEIKNLELIENNPILSLRDLGDTVIFTDSKGIFSFIPPFAGIWTFTLVNGDNNLKINNKELSFDSSISIKVKDSVMQPCDNI